jgi:hypothetical protein
MSVSKRLLVAADHIYRLLLHAYPRDFRRRYGAEMAQVFRDCCRDALARDGAAGIAGVCVRTAGDLLVSAFRERAATARRLKAPTFVDQRSTSMELSDRSPRMNLSFDTFTKRAKNALQLATEEARTLNHGYIGTEHLLLGLIRERNGVSGEVLHRLGVTLDQAREATQALQGVGQYPAPEVQPLSKRAFEAIEQAIEQSQQLEQAFVGTEHVLLGVIGTSNGAAAEVLNRLGLPADQVRAQVLRVLARQ